MYVKKHTAWKGTMAMCFFMRNKNYNYIFGAAFFTSSFSGKRCLKIKRTIGPA